ncbi:MAG: molybdate ABC transporter substrate-binding protein [Actinobacteria bacterium]|nr:molybdate ABC transporter substrate-binding protein [Actinomycetota bacterium]
MCGRRLTRDGRRRAAAALALGTALAAAGCGGGGRPAGRSHREIRPGAPARPAAAPALTGPLTVLAAASLTESLEDEKAALGRRAPGLRLTYELAGSQTLAQHVIQGAPADVFASADEDQMRRLVDAGLVERPLALARNRLAIAVAGGNPLGVAGLGDLSRPGLVVVLADPSVPAGRYARQALARAGVTVRPRSLELDVRSALAKVGAGEADAAVVYATDVRAAGPRVAGVEIPDDSNVTATYVIAVVKATKHRDAARALVSDLVSGPGQRALAARGFLPPS